MVIVTPQSFTQQLQHLLTKMRGRSKCTQTGQSHTPLSKETKGYRPCAGASVSLPLSPPGREANTSPWSSATVSLRYSTRRQSPAFFPNGQLWLWASAEHVAATRAPSKRTADAEKASEFPHYEVGTRKRNKIWMWTVEQCGGSMVRCYTELCLVSSLL